MTKEQIKINKDKRNEKYLNKKQNEVKEYKTTYIVNLIYTKLSYKIKMSDTKEGLLKKIEKNIKSYDDLKLNKSDLDFFAKTIAEEF